jgi:hypothetical protein
LDNLQEKGMKADMARLTLARKIAALALAIWKKGESFDPKKLKTGRISGFESIRRRHWSPQTDNDRNGGSR